MIHPHPHPADAGLARELAEMLEKLLHLPPPELRPARDGRACRLVQPEGARQVRAEARRLLDRAKGGVP